MERKTYFDPKLDQDDYDYHKMGSPLNPLEEPNGRQANLVSSLADDGYHYPNLDIDIPVRVVLSSTTDHCHLYFDTVKLTWWQYKELLTALGNAGILDPKYVAHSLQREQTLLRPEGVKKKHVRKKEEVKQDTYP